MSLDISASPLKGVLLGNAIVGKTCLFNRILDDSFSIHQPPTTDDWGSGEDRETVHFQFWDTNGVKIYRSITLFYSRDAQVALLCYEIND
jgi:small GTP-binding protein